MAKGVNALGKFRGKVGAMVLRVDAGVGQIISEYNPHPANPRTFAQTQQRSKMNLAGMLSRLTPYDAIVGLSTNKREARSKYVSNVLKNVTGLIEDDGMYFNNLSVDKLVFSKGISVPLQTAVSYLTSTNQVQVQLTHTNTQLNLLFIRVIVMMSGSGEWKHIDVKDVKNIVASTQRTIVFDVPTDIPVSATSGAAVFAVPVWEKDEAAAVAYGTILADNEGNTSVISTDITRTLVAEGAFCESAYIGKVAITNA